jgi:hypothetical protein
MTPPYRWPYLRLRANITAVDLGRRAHRAHAPMLDRYQQTGCRCLSAGVSCDGAHHNIRARSFRSLRAGVADDNELEIKDCAMTETAN